MQKNYLLTPGPTPVPEEALQAMSKPIIHHRTSQFQDILEQVEQDLKYVFKTQNDVLIFSSSGTGAMEGAVCNILSSKDEAIVVKGGKFGERWADLCAAYKINFTTIDVQWGKAVDPILIKKMLDDDVKHNRRIKAVFTTLCETSTGVSTDIRTIANVLKSTHAVLVVDAIRVSTIFF